MTNSRWTIPAPTSLGPQEHLEVLRVARPVPARLVFFVHSCLFLRSLMLKRVGQGWSWAGLREGRGTTFQGHGTE